MTQPIDIPVQLPGLDDAVREMLELARATGMLADKTETLSQAQQDESAAQRQATAARQQASQQVLAFSQRCAGAAMAVQSLLGQLGGQSHAAGLIGSTIAASTQFAQLGAAVGPGGALVGGIVGALVPALHELIEAQDEAAQSARRLREEEEILAGRRERIDEERRAQVDREVESGHILTLSEEEITRQTALLAERRSQVYTDLQRTVHALRIAERNGMDETSARFREWQGRAQTLREELVTVTRQINALDAATLSRGTQDAADQNADSARTAASRSRGGGPTRIQRAADEARQLMEFERLLADGEQEAFDREMDRLNEEYEANERLVQAKLRWQEELDEADKRSQQEERERALASLEAYETELRRQEDIAAAHQQVVTENVQSTMGSVIGSMTEVLGQLAQGNATVEESAKLMLAAFLQAMSQRAQIEALAEVARAISSYPDVAGIAIHAAGALAWGAVAVATGVGAGAISSDVSKAQAARKEAEKPAAPAKSSGSGGSGGQTIVVNFNSPVVTAQTEAGLGVSIRNTIGVSQRRFPSAA